MEKVEQMRPNAGWFELDIFCDGQRICCKQLTWISRGGLKPPLKPLSCTSLVSANDFLAHVFNGGVYSGFLEPSLMLFFQVGFFASEEKFQHRYKRNHNKNLFLLEAVTLFSLAKSLFLWLFFRDTLFSLEKDFYRWSFRSRFISASKTIISCSERDNVISSEYKQKQM